MINVSGYCALATRIYFIWLQLANTSKDEPTDWLCPPCSLNCSFQTEFYSVSSFSSLHNNNRAAVSSALVCIPYARLWILLEKYNLTECRSCQKLLIEIVSKTKIAFKLGMKCFYWTVFIELSTVFIFL